MAVEPADRFASAAGLREALEPVAAPEPEVGRSRRRTLLAAAAVGLVVVLALVAIRSVQAANERERWVSQQLDRVERLADAGPHYHPARLRFTLDGYRPRELLLPALLGSFGGDPGPLDPVELLPEASAPEGMVRIPG